MKDQQVSRLPLGVHIRPGTLVHRFLTLQAQVSVIDAELTRYTGADLWQAENVRSEKLNQLSSELFKIANQIVNSATDDPEQMVAQSLVLLEYVDGGDDGIVHKTARSLSQTILKVIGIEPL